MTSDESREESQNSRAQHNSLSLRNVHFFFTPEIVGRRIAWCRKDLLGLSIQFRLVHVQTRFAVELMAPLQWGGRVSCKGALTQAENE